MTPLRPTTLLFFAIVFASLFVFTYSAPVSVTVVRVQGQAGYLVHVFFESATASPCNKYNQNTEETYPSSSGSFTLAQGGPGGSASLCLFSPMVSSSQYFVGGTCSIVLYASLPPNGAIQFKVTAANTVVGSGTISQSGGASHRKHFTEYNVTFTCAAFTLTPHSYINVSLTVTSGHSVTVCFGPNCPTDFQVVQSEDTA